MIEIDFVEDNIFHWPWPWILTAHLFTFISKLSLSSSYELFGHKKKKAKVSLFCFVYFGWISRSKIAAQLLSHWCVLLVFSTTISIMKLSILFIFIAKLILKLLSDHIRNERQGWNQLSSMRFSSSCSSSHFVCVYVLYINFSFIINLSFLVRIYYYILARMINGHMLNRIHNILYCEFQLCQHFWMPMKQNSFKYDIIWFKTEYTGKFGLEIGFYAFGLTI